MEKMVLSILSATKIKKKSLYVLTPEIKYVENFDDAKPYPAKLDTENYRCQNKKKYGG